MMITYESCEMYRAVLKIYVILTRVVFKHLHCVILGNRKYQMPEVGAFISRF